MSEKIDQFVEKLRLQLTTVEQNLAKASENISTASQESADAMNAKIDDVKSRVAAIKLDADAKAAELREKIANCEDETKANIEEHVEKLRETCNAQINDLQQSWGDTVTDITGGVVSSGVSMPELRVAGFARIRLQPIQLKSGDSSYAPTLPEN